MTGGSLGQKSECSDFEADILPGKADFRWNTTGISRKYDEEPVEIPPKDGRLGLLSQAPMIGIISLGCAKNLVNSEQMMYLLKESGYEVSGDTDGADAVIVNTCGFIENAKTEAIDTILELGRMKSGGRIQKLIVAGCLAERYKDGIMTEMPEIDAVIGVGSFDDIVSVVRNAFESGEKAALFGDINASVSETGRIITTSPVWAYLKIAEGCDNRCAYCVIPDIRGRFRSRRREDVINEARELADHGIKELIIVAQDVTRYGLDLYGKRSLTGLLKELAAIEKLRWIRLHYLYPDEIDEELIDVIAENDKILKYLDIPIQHINDKILKNMRRRSTGAEIRELFARLRKSIPGVVLRTSLITGLPGEGKKEFEELGEFLRVTKIERAGVFVYSPEEGTLAAQMERPDADVAAHRAEILVDIQSRIIDEFNINRIGSLTTVLIEGRDGENYYGRSYAESPDIDGYITITGDNIPVNSFIEAKITGAVDGTLTGVWEK